MKMSRSPADVKMAECSTCGGSGFARCPSCNSEAIRVNTDDADLKGYRLRTTCTTCDGDGFLVGEDCTDCDGTGLVESDETDDDTLGDDADDDGALKEQ
jgi:DnaJ-class molecular chaperone